MTQSLSYTTRPPDPDQPHAPLLVLLHGYGADEHDLMGLGELADPRYRIVSPQAPIDLRSVGFPSGFAWFSLSPGPDGEIQFDLPGARKAVSMVVSFIEEMIDTYACDPDQVRLLGFSQGATLIHVIALLNLMPLAGIASFSGRLPQELTQDPAQASPGLPADFPVLLGHGSMDELIPVTYAHALRALYETTPAAITYVEEPIGHGIGPAGQQALQRWLTLDSAS